MYAYAMCARQCLKQVALLALPEAIRGVLCKLDTWVQVSNVHPDQVSLISCKQQHCIHVLSFLLRRLNREPVLYLSRLFRSVGSAT